jgi:signal transduction histidine kinase
VQVDIRNVASDAIELTISDDGPGASVDAITVGVGTAVIESWVGILKGNKEVDSAPGHGYQLRVLIPQR